MIAVVPRSSQNRIESLADGGWRVRITAPPVDGAANDALLKFMSTILDVPRSRLCIVTGESSRHKRVRVEGVASDALEQRLQQALLRQR
jgi:uncharacterized protein (TIGR00251 family)